MADVTLESLAAEVSYLRAAVDELLRRVGGVPPQTDAGPESLPDPIPGEGIGSYVARCGRFVGGEKGEQAVRMAGSLILPGIGQAYVDKYGGDWKLTAWRMIHGDPSYSADPRWQGYRPGT